MSAVAAQLGPRFRVLGSGGAYVKWGLDPQEAKLRAGERPTSGDFGAEDPSHWGRLGVDDAAQPVPTIPGDYRGFYAGLVTSLREGAPPPVDAADAIAGLEIIEAARRSSAERRVVTLTTS
jgi:predicted dehydrogenase